MTEDPDTSNKVPDMSAPSRIRVRLRILAEAAVGLFVGFVLLAGAFIFVLSSGPISIPALTPIIERSLSEAAAPYRAVLRDTQIVWSGWDRAIDVVAKDVTILEPGGEPGEIPLAILPEISVGLSFKDLLQGTFRLKTLELLHPQISLVRAADGSFSLAFETTENSQDNRPDGGLIRMPSGSEDGGEISSAVLEFLALATQEPLASLHQFNLVQAEVRIKDEASGDEVWLHSADLGFIRNENGLEAQLYGLLEASSQKTTIHVESRVLEKDEEMQVALHFGDLDTALAKRYFPDLRHYLPDLLVQGTVEAAFDFAGAPLSGQARAIIEPDMTLLSAMGELRSESGDFDIRLDPVAAGLKGQATLSGLQPDHLAAAIPAFSEIRGFTASVAAKSSFLLSHDLAPLSGFAEIRLGKGHIKVPGFKSPLPELEQGEINLDFDGEAKAAQLKHFLLDFGQTDVRADGAFSWQDGNLKAEIDALLNSLEMNRLPEFWPVELSPNLRTWVTENIPEAHVHEAALKAKVTVPEMDPDQFLLNDLSGHIQFDEGEVHYFRPWQPVTDVSGKATFDADSFSIAVASGTLKDAVIESGHIEITGLDIEDEYIEISVQVDTPVGTALTLLNSPPNRLISRLGVNADGIHGTASAELRFSFPLLLDLEIDQVRYETDAILFDISALRPEFGGLVTSDGLDLSLRPGVMMIKGPVDLGDVAANAKWTEFFSPDAGLPGRLLSLSTRTDLENLSSIGLDTGAYASGPAGLDLTYALYPSGAESFILSADLKEALLELELLDWQKEPGLESDLSAKITLDPQGGGAIDSLVIDGKNHHQIQGAADLTSNMQTVKAARIDRLKLGRTDLAGSVQWQGDHYDIVLSGPALDVSGFLSESEMKPREKNPPVSDPGFVISGDFKQLSGRSGQAVTDSHLKLEMQGQDVYFLSLTGLVGGGEEVDLSYYPLENGGRELNLATGDAGRLLAFADVTEQLEGGDLAISARSRSQKGPLEGRLTIRDFNLRDAPRLTKILEGLSVTGLISAFGDRGLPFETLVADFVLEENKIDISEASAKGPSMGIAFSGNAGRGPRGSLDMNGEIAVSDIFSKTLSQLPIINFIVGEGLIGAAFTVEGSRDDPDITVNPLSVITPGFLRKVFNARPGDQDQNNHRDKEDH